jgi:hypothetical protein
VYNFKEGIIIIKKLYNLALKRRMKLSSHVHGYCTYWHECSVNFITNCPNILGLVVSGDECALFL